MPRAEYKLHAFAPVYDSESRVLILGSMPSVQSVKTGFYYGHPRNVFWRVLAEIFHEATPKGNEEKIAFLHRHHIALWDVLASCEIKGSSDSSIKNAVANDLAPLLKATQIKTIFTTGQTASRFYEKLCFPVTGIQNIPLPSTSPANIANYSYDDLVSRYHLIKDALR